MASLSLKQGSLLCQILFSSLIVLDILAATNTILPTLAHMLEQQEQEQNRTDLNLNLTSNDAVAVVQLQGVDIALGVAEIAALAILIICNMTALR